ncbi:hypothetical protein L226DRAFT_2338 [Lentinus tigrinus ALCF2SS1-7]|uniref:uncharacterized protein n=1 Tax=Lentinus tigrinus ALCF2SS1-7 TaxID=1328758 RepID=UPI001165E2A6|nr:hypothetical protein L226DRAFT_2338 [Lentinus tigrinus ALCF2SS1-7]
MSFFIDGILVGNFVQPPTGDTTYQYNVPVYVNESLPSGSHTIAIVNGHPSGNQSLTLLDRIVYTQDITSSGNSTSSLTPSLTAPAASTTSSPPNAMAETTSTSSHTRTIVIATVASIGGVLFLVAAIALIIYFGRRRQRTYQSPRDGVIAPDAAPIDEDDPGTSGWVEGTWTGDDESTTGTGRRSNSGKRKRGASNAQSPAPPVPSKPVLPVLPKTKSPTVPQSAMSGIQAFHISPMSHARTTPAPLSPTSSFGNLTSTVPDSATYLLTPAESAAYPGPGRYTNPHTNADSSDTFLDMGQSFRDADVSLTTLSSHNAHPFATAQAVAPSSFGPSRQRSTTRNRSDSNQSSSSQVTVSAALPTTTLSAASRGPARGPAKKPSNSDLVSPSASTPASAAPSAYGNATASASGSRIARSPSPSTLPSTATTPTSTTTLMPKRQGSNAGATSRGPAPPRRVDPVDPMMQPPRDRNPDAHAYGRDREREREREREQERQRGHVQGPRQAQPQSQPRGQERKQYQTQPQPQPQEQAQEQDQRQNKGGRRQGMMMSDRDRKRFGFLDVPQDAADLDSRPPSYRETS